MQYRSHPVCIVDRCWLAYRDALRIINRRVRLHYERVFTRCARRGINY